MRRRQGGIACERLEPWKAKVMLRRILLASVSLSLDDVEHHAGHERGDVPAFITSALATVAACEHGLRLIDVVLGGVSWNSAACNSRLATRAASSSRSSAWAVATPCSVNGRIPGLNRPRDHGAGAWPRRRNTVLRRALGQGCRREAVELCPRHYAIRKSASPLRLSCCSQPSSRLRPHAIVISAEIEFHQPERRGCGRG
jgi:hypothetical protein